ncbi:MAG: ABC transporter ATP-binding protein, partial [Desulfobacterales bacterium]|nr:ABC transporter ATP-binding protein [Desulfobacterales bacterium]
MKTAVEIKNASFDYGENRVLKEISFSVGEGDFFIIIGPNGSGKTTLMKLMAGVAALKEGSLRILERPVHGYSRKALARTLALVPQTIPEEFPFTVSELVLMGRAPHQGILGLESAKDMEIAVQAMTFTGVAHLATRKMTQLSGGERQRVFIARAICQEPKIILLDEPTASLDLAHQVRVMD